MNIKQLIESDLPNFTGVVVADGAAPLEVLQNLRASVAWRFKIENALEFDEVLVAGNIKKVNKGSYFIAQIKNIVTIREFANMPEHQNVIDYQNKHYGNWIANAIRKNEANTGLDSRNAIIFEKPTEIRQFSTNFFSYLSNPVSYVK